LLRQHFESKADLACPQACTSWEVLDPLVSNSDPGSLGMVVLTAKRPEA
jgi:hypothetical protein